MLERNIFKISSLLKKMTQPWTEQYRPRDLREVYGQDDAVAKLRSFVAYFERQRKKAALLYGPSGSGKTALAYAFALELGYEIVDLNASDFRNKEQVNRIIGQAIKQQSLFARGKLILIDEIDGLSGTKDRGGVAALLKLIGTTKFPVILTANDIWQQKLSKIRTKVELIQLNRLNYIDITEILQRICLKAMLEIDEKMLKEIAVKASGDARAAINDLQVIATQAAAQRAKTKIRVEISKEDIAVLGKRKKDVSISDALRVILKGKDAALDAIDAFENVDLNIDDCFLWLDENLPLEYKQESLAKAYEALSKADIFRGRIRRWQHWRFLTYVNALMTAGVALAKEHANSEFVSYKRPSRILQMWIAKQKNLIKTAIASKLAKTTHCSRKKALAEMPYLQITCRNKKMLNDIAKELKLTQNEMNYFLY